MRALLELSVKKPVAVIMALAAALIAGIFSLSVLPIQRLPGLSIPKVTVETRYPGMGAEDIRSIVTIPIEDALSPVKGLKRIRSVSRDGASLVTLDFGWGTESGAASVLVREAIDAVYPGLPEGVEKPAVIPGDPGEEPQIIAAVKSRHGGAFARNLAEYEIRSRLRRIEGVGAVMIAGGETPLLEIRADISRTVSRGIFPADLAGMLASETANIPAGNAREGDKEIVVVSSGRLESAEELARLVFPSENGPFNLNDAGSIKTGTARKKSLFIWADKNGADEQTALEIYRRPGADPVRLSREVKKTIEEAAAAFGRDAEIGIVWDDAPSIMDGIWKLVVSSCFGIAAVVIVLFFSLRRLRCSALAAFSIPFSTAVSLAALAACGSSLNGMSLSGIALGTGLVSDTAVIMLDLLHGSFGAGKKRPPPEEVSQTASSIAASSLGGTLTTAIVFLPVLFLPGPLGSLFRDLSITLVVSIGAGWLYAQFALPCLYRVFFRGVKKSAAVSLPLHAVYTKWFRKVLRKPVPFFVFSALLSVLGFFLLMTRPALFVSPGAARELELLVRFPAGTTLEAMIGAASDIARMAAALSEFKSVFGRAGAEDEDAGKRADPDYRKENFLFRCILVPGADPEKALDAARTRITSSGAECIISFPRSKTEKLLGLSASTTLAVKGKDRSEVNKNLAAAEERISSSKLALECSARPSGTRPEIRIRPDREASAYLGISAGRTARAVYAAFEGIEAGELEIEGKPLPVKVLSDLKASGGISALDTVPVALTENGPVFLGSIAGTERREVSAALLRLDRSDAVYLDVQAAPGCKTKLLAFLGSLCGRDEIPGLSRADDSVFVQYRNSLVLTTALVLLLLYFAIGALFESFTLPLIFMLTIPFSLAGAGPALFLRGAGIDSSSVLGLVVLFGLAVNSGMVLYERAGEKIGQGSGPAASVYGAARERFQPVLATALTTVSALLPLVFSPPGSGQRSMAAAMLGGVSVSTVVSLFALPSIFIRYFKRKRP
jgi:multidrug efflux pump subunit AcrB